MLKIIVVASLAAVSLEAAAAGTGPSAIPEGFQNAAIQGPVGRSKRCRVLNVPTGRYASRCFTRDGRQWCVRVPLQGRRLVCS